MIKQLAITSFHRSGSSLTAQYLHNAGLNMGRKLLRAMQSNPYGHYEDIEVIQINDDLLNHQGGAWFNDHAIYSAFEYKLLIRIQNYLSYRAITHSQFAFKDPRLCVTVRSWLTASNSLKFLFIHRGALRSCKSLWRRAYDDYRAGKATSLNKRLIANKSSIYNLYLNNVGNFLSTAKSLQNWKDRIIFISYDDLVNEKIDLTQILKKKWGFEIQGAPISEYFDPNAVTSDSDSDDAIDDKLLDELEQLDKQILDYCGEKN